MTGDNRETGNRAAKSGMKSTSVLMLTLDERTLFYVNLRSSSSTAGKKGAAALIEDWAVGVANKRGSTSSSKTSDARSLYTATTVTAKVTTATAKGPTASAKVPTATAKPLTAAAKSTSAKAVHNNATAPSRTVSIHTDSSSEVEIVKYPALDQLEDNEDDEREAAHSSPIKGRKRLTSEVWLPSHLC
jgi:hypothetical protein